MATFDQLPADQRAIIELVLKRGRTYAQLADMLDMTEARVRELAIDALVRLSPFSANRVDEEWRDKIGDYVLGQQSGADSTSTHGHLASSETGRAWVTSLTDSLEELFGEDAVPDLPEPSETSTRARDRRPRGEDRPAREERPSREERPARSARGARASAATATKEDRKPSGKEPREATAGDGDQRASAQRRRLIGGGAVLAVLLLVLVLVLTGVIGGGDDDDGGSSDQAANGTTTGASPDTPAGQGAQGEIVGELALRPTDEGAAEDTVGIAQIASDGKTTQVGIRAKLPRLAAEHAYEVWLYNSKTDAVSLGASRLQANGTFEGAAPLPNGYEKYKFIDISDEPVDRNTDHSGDSVLRGALADIVAPQDKQQQGEEGGG